MNIVWFGIAGDYKPRVFAKQKGYFFSESTLQDKHKDIYY